ncbi:TPA: DUF3653 domain-containing protein [Photobacterium damselae]
MKLYSCRDLTPLGENWEGWKLCNGQLITPSGKSLAPDRILTAIALMEIGDKDSRENQVKIIQTARMLKQVRH